jgi:hypothetical protein
MGHRDSLFSFNVSSRSWADADRRFSATRRYELSRRKTLRGQPTNEEPLDTASATI